MECKVKGWKLAEYDRKPSGGNLVTTEGVFLHFLWHMNWFFLFNGSYCPGGPDSDFEYSTQSYTGYEVSFILPGFLNKVTVCYFRGV